MFERSSTKITSTITRTQALMVAITAPTLTTFAVFASIARTKLSFALVLVNGTEGVNAMFYLLLRTFINPQQPLRSEFSITPAYLLRSLMFGWRKFHEGEKELSKYRQRNPIMPLGFPDGSQLNLDFVTSEPG
jgi:hypothetical protein